MNEFLLGLHKRLLAEGGLSGPEKALLFVLKVLSIVFESVARLRVAAYRTGLLSTYRSRLKVISVGNLAAGGTGKTPVCDDVIKRCQHLGRKVALLSRGYGGRYQGSCGLVSDGNGLLLTAKEAGDEPVLLAQRNPEVVVVVARKRAAGLRFIEENFSVDVVILDDAFQHLQVQRDLDIVLLDASSPFGNGFTLPAGILREPRSALTRADVVLFTRSNGRSLPLDRLPVPSLGCLFRLAPVVRALNGASRTLDSLKDEKVLLFAGIAHPEVFFDSVCEAGLSPEKCIPFVDHQAYDEGTVQRIMSELGAEGVLLTTEKDAAKLTADIFPVPCYLAELELEFDRPTVLDRLLSTVLAEKERALNVNEELMEILACPKCKGPVALEKATATPRIVCTSCALAYPVRDDIPVMLIDEAQALNE